MEFTDGIITIKPFELADTAEHLRNEDEEQIRWISGGKSTEESVRNWITETREEWKRGGPAFTFAVWAEGEIIGMVEANTKTDVEGIMEGDANISYAIYPAWRGKGYAKRAVNLIVEFLKQKNLKRAVIRVLPENVNSVRVPLTCGFNEERTVETKEGRMIVYRKSLV